MTIASGTRLGAFEVLEQIGAGGMGQVYRARDTRLGRDVALKVLPPQLFDQEEWVARFDREAKIISSLNHPNILTIHEISQAPLPGTTGTVHYLVTEFIDGRTLREALTLEDGTVLIERLAQVADALQKAHGAGVVHRDLKPENIMFTSDGFAKVLDFGLAKMATTRSSGASFQTQQGIAVGTIGYMAPEQMQGRPVDHRADVFSFGCILFEVLTGSLPFRGETLIEMLHAIATARTPALPATVALPLRQLVKRCLEKNADERPQSMQEVAATLRASAARPRASAARLPAATRKPANSSSSRIRTLAIMPFTNVSGDPEVEYLSDGITETIIYTLSQVRKRLRVIARNTTFLYKGKSFTPQQLAEEIGATAMVTGRVQRLGGTIVVAADLVSTQDGMQIWGERFHRPVADIFEVQDQIATSISDQLKLKLSVGDRQRLVRRPTRRAEAYEHYLKGRFFLNRRTTESLQQALASFRAALDIDAKYAQAWAGLAEAHTVLSKRTITGSDENTAFAEDAARRAIALEPSLAEPHATLGLHAFIHRWQWDEADRYFREAIRLDPQSTTALQWHAGLLAWMGLLDEARHQARLAVECEPLSLLQNLNYAGMLWVSGRLEEAMTATRKVLDLEPRFFFAHWMHSRILLARGLDLDAVRVLRTAADECGRHPELLGTLGFALARSGHTDDAHALRRELESGGDDAPHPMPLAEIWLGLGDFDRSLRYVEDLFLRRADLGVVLTAPEFEPLRRLPAFEQMLLRVGFPERKLRTSFPRTIVQSYADQV